MAVTVFNHLKAEKRPKAQHEGPQKQSSTGGKREEIFSSKLFAGAHVRGFGVSILGFWYFKGSVFATSPATEMSKSIVKGIGIGFLSCIGIGIAKTISQVLVMVLVLLRRQPKYWYC